MAQQPARPMGVNLVAKSSASLPLPPGAASWWKPLGAVRPGCCPHSAPSPPLFEDTGSWAVLGELLASLAPWNLRWRKGCSPHFPDVSGASSQGDWGHMFFSGRRGGRRSKCAGKVCSFPDQWVQGMGLWPCHQHKGPVCNVQHQWDSDTCHS